ncbi:hypothetical protein LOAG_08727 [Loa loa]|uniref:Uncharacterized protein n=1 Tax=Loa loa TaxID=7209 RepID=A0A1I7VRD0_LOALO|nr:hypothetical protein LOAG_08727 [Loa loa]EFO19765.1 hypothetical protein LOAG_08727 [Loa loa]
MDFFSTIEDPRHTPGKRHGYAKEQLAPQTFISNNQRSLLSNFITTPPVVKSQNYFTGYSGNKFYLAKQQKQERNNYTSLYPSQKSAFLTYKSVLRNSPNQKPPEMQTDPPPIISNTLIAHDGILKPKPRYITSISQEYNKNATEFGNVEYFENNNSGTATILEADTINSRQGSTTPQHRPIKMACSEFGSRESPIAEKIMKDVPRLNNFKNILNKFQIASDHALRQQQQREQIRYNASGHESDQGFNIPNLKQSTEPGYSEQDCTFTKNKAFTMSIPTAGKNIRNSLPKQWIMQENDTHVDMEQRSLTISGISSLPPSPSLSSSHKPPNRTNSLRLVSMKQRTFFDNNFHRNEPVRSQLQYNINRSRLISGNEAIKSPTSIPSSSHGCIIRCTSTESYKKLTPVTQVDTHPSLLSKSEPRSISNQMENDNELVSVIGLYKQAEPVFVDSSPIKPDLTIGNIWNPPTLVEIRAKRNEEHRILHDTLHQNSQKYRFLIIPRHTLFTFKSFASNHQYDISEEYEQKVCFILLQLVYALKSFQLNGIEMVSDDLSEFILLSRYTRTNHKIGSMDHLPRILLLQESLRMTNKKSIVGLCDYGLKILSTMLNLHRNSLRNFATPIQESNFKECVKALQHDKSSSLTEAKNALEFGMFVGHDASSLSDEEDAQAWIDSKRADYVNYLFREVAGGSCLLNDVYERLRLQFLLSVTPQTLLKMLDNMHLQNFK